MSLKFSYCREPLLGGTGGRRHYRRSASLGDYYRWEKVLSELITLKEESIYL